MARKDAGPVGGGPAGARQLSVTPGIRGPPWPQDPTMVRAGAVGTHLPASGLDIFGDLRKMNKRQVSEARVGGVPRGRGWLRLQGVKASQ